MRALVTGTTGYVGGLVAGALTAAGHEVRGFARGPVAAGGGPAVTVRGDLATGAGLEEALDGADVAYYLVHSMEGNLDFASAELAAAERFAAAAARAGTPRIVYMGVLVPATPEHTWSSHVRSRIAVEHALAEHGAQVVALRASIVVGAGSRSFRFLLRLVQRLPVLLLPPWRDHRTAPIDERDLVRQLVAAASVELHQPLTVSDAVGPDVVTYRALIELIRDELLAGRPSIPFPLALTDLAAPIAAAVAGEDPGLVHALMSSLDEDLLAQHRAGPAVDLGTPRHSLRAAVERALRHSLSTTDQDD